MSKIASSSDKKCFYVFSTDCKYESVYGKDIGYKKECSEFSVTKVLPDTRCVNWSFVSLTTICMTPLIVPKSV